MAVILWQSSLRRFNGDQAVGGLPLLIGELSVCNLQKVMIIECGLFVVTQVVISGGPKKETDRGHLRIYHGAPIEGSDCKFVVLVLAGRKGKIDIDIGPIAF